MAQVTYDEIEDGDIRSAADVNAILTAFQTQSTNITASNIRDEGLDQRSLSTGTATDSTERYVENTDTAGNAVNTGGAWQTLVLGANTFNIAGGWAVGQGVGVVRVRFRTWWSYYYGAVHPVGASPTIQFRLAYGIDGGAVTTVPYSTRAFNGVDRVSQGGPDYVDYYRDNFKYAFLIPFPMDGAAHTLDYVRVQVNTPGANWTIFPSTFTAMRFIKGIA